MPNLSQIYALKEQYYDLTAEDRQVKDFIEKSEAKDVLQKAFNSERLGRNVEERRTFSFINESLSLRTPEIIKYFDEGKEEDVALLFIDITSFSKTITGWSNSQIKKYLDDYYEKVIPIIYNNGGEIEKLMGDGIICVFGKPFLDLSSVRCVYKAETCAEEVIKAFYGTTKNVKVAIHRGNVNYYKVPGEHYGEYTIIGQPITDLYRLESVAKGNAINFYEDSTYDKLGWDYSIFDKDLVYCRDGGLVNLQGVNFNRLKYITFPGYN